jgi:hypothetical protein
LMTANILYPFMFGPALYPWGQGRLFVSRLFSRIFGIIPEALPVNGRKSHPLR